MCPTRGRAMRSAMIRPYPRPPARLSGPAREWPIPHQARRTCRAVGGPSSGTGRRTARATTGTNASTTTQPGHAGRGDQRAGRERPRAARRRQVAEHRAALHRGAQAGERPAALASGTRRA